MPLDAICLSAVVRETAAQVENTRIEKIQQPARDQVVLLLRGGRRLLLCAGATQPRLHLTALLRDNPSQPPMFCMLLRKHLSGARLLELVQPPMERVVDLRLEALDELGECLPGGQSEEELIENRVLTEALNRFLASLPEQNRKIFILRYWYLCSVGKIAQSLGLSESGVKMSLLRTRRQLKTMLQKEGIHL